MSSTVVRYRGKISFEELQHETTKRPNNRLQRALDYKLRLLKDSKSTTDRLYRIQSAILSQKQDEYQTRLKTCCLCHGMRDPHPPERRGSLIPLVSKSNLARLSKSAHSHMRAESSMCIDRDRLHSAQSSTACYCQSPAPNTLSNIPTQQGETCGHRKGVKRVFITKRRMSDGSIGKSGDSGGNAALAHVSTTFDNISKYVKR